MCTSSRSLGRRVGETGQAGDGVDGRTVDGVDGCTAFHDPNQFPDSIAAAD